MAQHGRPSLVYTKQVLVLPVTDCLPARPGLNDLNLSREVITTIHFARAVERLAMSDSGRGLGDPRPIMGAFVAFRCWRWMDGISLCCLQSEGAASR